MLSTMDAREGERKRPREGVLNVWDNMISLIESYKGDRYTVVEIYFYEFSVVINTQYKLCYAENEGKNVDLDTVDFFAMFLHDKQLEWTFNDDGTLYNQKYPVHPFVTNFGRTLRLFIMDQLYHKKIYSDIIFATHEHIDIRKKKADYISLLVGYNIPFIFEPETLSVWYKNPGVATLVETSGHLITLDERGPPLHDHLA